MEDAENKKDTGYGNKSVKVHNSEATEEGIYSRTRGIKRQRINVILNVNNVILKAFIASQDASTEPETYEQAI